jgi:MFS family permease
MWILTACYGAGFSVIPAFLADKFGPKNVGACHGVLLTAWSMAAVVGGVVFTLIFNHYSSQDNLGDPFPYNINTWWLCGVVFLGWLALLFVKPTKKDVQVWKGVTCRK